MKIWWFDTETTGLDPRRNDVISLACIIDIDGEIKEEFKLNIQPFDWDNIEAGALKVNGMTIDQLKTFMSPKEAHRALCARLNKYVDPYNKNDKFQPAGYNVAFDINFLSNFFKKCDDRYFGSWIDYHNFDVYSLIQFLHLSGDLNLDRYRLQDVAKHFGIPITAHDAMSDIKATREIVYKILPRISYSSEDDYKCPNEIGNKTICNMGYACDSCPYNNSKKEDSNGS